LVVDAFLPGSPRAAGLGNSNSTKPTRTRTVASVKSSVKGKPRKEETFYCFPSASRVSARVMFTERVREQEAMRIAAEAESTPASEWDMNDVACYPESERVEAKVTFGHSDKLFSLLPPIPHAPIKKSDQAPFFPNKPNPSPPTPPVPDETLWTNLINPAGPPPAPMKASKMPLPSQFVSEPIEQTGPANLLAPPPKPPGVFANSPKEGMPAPTSTEVKRETATPVNVGPALPGFDNLELPSFLEKAPATSPPPSGNGLPMMPNPPLDSPTTPH
jgi:hypothetical protein